MDKFSKPQFEREGYLVIRNFFDHGFCEEAQAEMMRLHRDFTQLKETYPDLHRLGEWSIRSPVVASEFFRMLIRTDCFPRLCHELLGDDVDLYWSATAAKPKGSGRAFPWHQDSGYGGPREYMTIWSAFDEVDEENGCLWAIPGSHREGIFEHEFRKADSLNYAGPFLKEPHTREDQKIAIQLSPGDVVCMHSELVHASFQNPPHRERRGLITAFISHGPHKMANNVGPEERLVPYLRGGVLENGFT